VVSETTENMSAQMTTQVSPKVTGRIVVTFYEQTNPRVEFDGVPMTSIPLLLKRVAKDVEVDFLR
jgi:hypothetical protein